MLVERDGGHQVPSYTMLNLDSDHLRPFAGQ